MSPFGLRSQRLPPRQSVPAGVRVGQRPVANGVMQLAFSGAVGVPEHAAEALAAEGGAAAGAEPGVGGPGGRQRGEHARGADADRVDLAGGHVGGLGDEDREEQAQGAAGGPGRRRRRPARPWSGRCPGRGSGSDRCPGSRSRSSPCRRAPGRCRGQAAVDVAELADGRTARDERRRTRRWCPTRRHAARGGGRRSDRRRVPAGQADLKKFP